MSEFPQPMDPLLPQDPAALKTPDDSSHLASSSKVYSPDDVQRILTIQQLARELGINLAGVEEINRLQQELEGQKRKMQLKVQDLNCLIGYLEAQIDAR